jgi:hypothetical protein
MESESRVSRIIADTDALLFWGNSQFLRFLLTNVGITTTNACVGEVTRHANKGENSRFGTAVLNSDERRRKQAAEAILPYINPTKSYPQGINTDDVTINAEFCGITGLAQQKGGGEKSIAKLVSQYPNSVEFVAMMDSGRNEDFSERGGRELVLETVPDWNDSQISFISPASVIALLANLEIISKSEACSDLATLIKKEGWPNTAWHDVPLDCPQGPDFLPDSFP